MKIAVVGHGPSMIGGGKGSYIDTFDKVVRLKGSGSVLGNSDYGNRVDALCASTEVMGNFFKCDSQEYWAYPKNGGFDGNLAINAIAKLEKPVMIPLLHCNYWNNRFKQMGAVHPNVSTGMAAILIAIKRWNPKEIVLFGFDTLMNPEIEFDRNPSIPRTGAGPYPNHDWKKEKQLLTVLENVYRVEIRPA